MRVRCSPGYCPVVGLHFPCGGDSDGRLLSGIYSCDKPATNALPTYHRDDPGHGGIDPGAVSASGLLEKDIVLAISRELESLLNQAAVRTFLTRRGDYDLADNVTHNLLERKRQDLQRRVELAEDCNAILHCHPCQLFPLLYLVRPDLTMTAMLRAKRLAEAIQANWSGFWDKQAPG